MKTPYYFLFAVALAMLWMACGPATSEAEAEITRLEGQLESMSSDSSISPFSAEFQETVQALVAAYEDYIAANPQQPQTAAYLLNAARYHESYLMHPQKAIAHYERYRELFPDGARAGDALFNIAWIYHNSLKDTQMAKTYYEAFLAQYPGHKLEESARFELEHLGMSDEELFESLSKDSLP